MAQKPTAKHTLVSDPQLAQLLQSYENGLRAMQEHKYDKAKTLLQKVVAGNNRELADRAAVHMNACNQQMERGATQFKTAEEHYDFVVPKSRRARPAVQAFVQILEDQEVRHALTQMVFSLSAAWRAGDVSPPS